MMVGLSSQEVLERFRRHAVFHYKLLHRSGVRCIEGVLGSERPTYFEEENKGNIIQLVRQHINENRISSSRTQHETVK